MKKVGKYIIITLLMLLGLCCVGVLYLFFIPKSSLFNITYINHNKQLQSEKYNISNVVQVDLNSRAYDVNILSTDESFVYVEINCNSFGFVLTKNKDTSITSYVNNSVLTFNIIEPYGFAVKNNSYINLYIPKTSNLNLNLSNKKAKTTIKSSNLQINNLTYSTNSGNFNFNEGKINGSMNLNLDKSVFTLNENVQTNNNDVKLSMTSGKFYATKSTLGNIEITNNERGVIDIQNCNNFIENQSSAGGQIYIDKVEYISLTASDTIVEITDVTDGAIIDLKGSGKITINKVQAYSTLTTKSGDITINNCDATVILHTDTGNIDVQNAMKTVSIKTNHGNATVNFSNDAKHYSPSDETKTRTLYATIHNGTLTATGVEHIGVADENEEFNFTGLKVTGNGQINLSMNDVCGENSIAGKDGNINVVVNTSSQYILKTSSKTGNVRVNLAQIEQSYGYTSQEEQTTLVNCSNSTNTLTVSTNQGNLTLLDNLMYENGF